jgi:hypothetical protein
MTEKPAVPVEPLSALREAIIDRHNLSTSSHNAALWNDCMDPICSGLAEFQLATLDAARSLPPDEDGLDVDVLSRAEHIVACDCPGDDSPGCHLRRWAARERATRVAAEYGRIAALNDRYAALGAAPVEDET